ncbi:MAG: YicC family protein [Clostridiales bacterium]|nr:YicC family protein [Clostridiales bacterium]
MGYSMTGYGQGEAIRPERRIMVEIKSVNSRYRDISFRLPRSLSSLEPPLRELINKCVNRGKVDVRVEYDSDANSGTQIKLDRDLALSYMAAYAELEELTNRLLPDLTGNLTQINGLFTVSAQETDPAEIWPQIEEATDAALDQFMSMRRNEGEMLCRDLRYKIEQLTEQLSAVSLRAETVPQEQRERLLKRVETLLGQDAEEYYNGQRIAAEIAIFADKAAIDEELVRLDSHLRQFDLVLDEEGQIGKKLDFLCQEINREINTIGSKSADLEISGLVVQMKTTLEKMREQVQNLE